MATKRQVKAIRNMVKNGGVVSTAMIDAGYSVNTAKTPKKLTTSVAFIGLSASLPEELLSKVHREGLEATRLGRTGMEDWDEVPDHSTRHKYLDSAYKLKGLYAPDKSISVNVDIAPTEALKKLAHGLLDNQRRRLGSSERAVSEPLGSTTTDKE